MRRTWLRELLGMLAAAALAVLPVSVVASTARSELLFRDGDSLVVALFTRSVLAGDALDWAMSSVLFLPESVMFAVLDLLNPADVNGVLAASAVVNLLALYGALRLVAGRQRPGAAPVAWALVGLGAFGVLAMTETSASRDAMELASLLLTTTYYSASVVAVVATVGLLRRALERDGHHSGLLIALGLIAAASTLSNPLYAVWATVPIAVILTVLVVRERRRAPLFVMLAVLLVGTAVGLIARLPFGPWIANTGAEYAQPARWAQSLVYYGDLVALRLSTPLGVLGCTLSIALLVIAVWRSVRAQNPATRLVATAAWVIPLLVAVGAIALGTHAARYLQPLAFAPVLALVAAPGALTIPPRIARQLAAVGAAVLVAGGAISIPRLVAAAHAPDADLACVTDWVEASGRTGAGQFWTVRLPKLHLDDPGQLVQVDHQLRGYAWLVNRADFEVAEVSFLVEDATSVKWQLPVSAVPDEVIGCGRYQILDFGEAKLPLGPQRS